MTKKKIQRKERKKEKFQSAVINTCLLVDQSFMLYLTFFLSRTHEGLHIINKVRPSSKGQGQKNPNLEETMTLNFFTMRSRKKILLL